LNILLLVEVAVVVQTWVAAVEVVAFVLGQ
jgi:hypothetical protein